MLGISTNPDTETLKILLLVTLSVMSLLVLLLGYFMRRRDQSITTATDNLIIAVDQLKLIVNGFQTQYSVRQPLVDAELKTLATSIIRLNEVQIKNSDQLLKLQTEHDMFHCKYPISPALKKLKANEKNQ